MGGGIASHPPSEWQSPSFVPQPPPSRKGDVVRPSVPMPPAMQQEPPAQKGGAFVPVLTPSTPKQANGKAPIPPRIIDVPADQPVALKTPQETSAPVPFLPTTPMIGLAQDPNPFAPYCGPDNELTPASALCRAASDAGLSDYCRQQLLAFLGSKSSQTLGSWIAAQELCDQAALRRAVGIAEASIASKTSAGLYDKPGYGNPFGVDGYAWKQDRVRKPSPFASQDNGATMDYRNPSKQVGYFTDAQGLPLLPEGKSPFAPRGDGSTMAWNQPPKSRRQFMESGVGDVDTATGFADDNRPNVLAPKGSDATMAYRNPSGGMPNYHRPSGLTAAQMAAQDAELDRLVGGRQAMSSDWTIDGMSADLYNQQNPIAPPVPATPPVDYAALIGGIGTAVGASLAGIGALVNTTQQNRLRELEIEYANNARGAQLALQRSAMEMQAEIARLSAQSTPAAQATVTALQQQVADANARLNAAATADQGMGTGTVVAIVGGAVVVLGIGAYALMGKGGRR